MSLNQLFLSNFYIDDYLSTPKPDVACHKQREIFADDIWGVFLLYLFIVIISQIIITRVINDSTRGLT